MQPREFENRGQQEGEANECGVDADDEARRIAIKRRGRNGQRDEEDAPMLEVTAQISLPCEGEPMSSCRTHRGSRFHLINCLACSLVMDTSTRPPFLLSFSAGRR